MINGAGKQALKKRGPAVTNSFAKCLASLCQVSAKSLTGACRVRLRLL
jgi:hypothetical protein